MSTEWSVHVEYDAVDVADDVHDQVIDLLSPYSARPGAVPSTGNFGIQMSVDAPTAEVAGVHAVAAAGTAMRAAYGPARVVAIEVLTPAELDRRNYNPTPDLEGKLVGRAEVAEILGVNNPQHADQIMQTAWFKQHARPVARLKSGPVYLVDQVRKAAEVREQRIAARAQKTASE